MDDVLHDNEGENISKKNREYCELTAHYYAWMNIESDYYGFCHYRRFFGDEKATGRSYSAIKQAPLSQLLSEGMLRKLCDEFEIIAPRSEDMGLTVRKHYNTSIYHYPEDLSLFLEILEKEALSLVGTDVYEKFVKGYTEKQWGRPCSELPAFIIKRLPLRFTYDNNYFNDRYQGVPESGYTAIFEGLLKGIEVLTSTDYKRFIADNPDIAEKTVYTYSVDEFFDYCCGKLECRSLRFETEALDEAKRAFSL